MRYSIIFSSTALIASTLAAYVPSEPWTTLTPTGSAPTGATTDHTHKFGIQVKTVESSVAISSTVAETDSAITAAASASGAAKRDDVVNQIGDGQVQQQTAQTASVVNQIGDGQIQQQTAQTASVVNQIGDGQIQQQTAKPTPTASVVNQIGDGQIQQQTAQTASVVNQIGDGQIQQQTAQTASVVNQIGDGQIQQQTAAAETASVVNQIGDGQVQQQTSQSPTTATVASQINDGQVQQQTDSAKSPSDSDSTVPQSCVGDSSLGMQLNGSVLTDEKGRIGAIVSNRQFQFDGPPPQAGSIYAAGWSVTENGLLALGDQTIFYQCHSGDFYNLYDESIAEQCSAVHLAIVDLVEC
ncbi:unnamed protein product [Debaryomyces tyrocola]|nr:unnamed protein product [Debaryomyces tyrocola]